MKNMLDYVAESNDVMKKNIENSSNLTKTLVEEYISGNYKNIWIIASGSSSNAANCSKNFIQKYLECDVKVITPFSFEYCENNFKKEDLVICVSQSGYSTNTINALQLVKNKGKKAIGLTGDLNSDFKNYADLLIDYGVGIETVAYVTKGVSTLALFFMLFSLEAANSLGKITNEEKENIKLELKKATKYQKEMQIKFKEFYSKNYKYLTSMKNAYVCSCGSNIGTAMEGALKIGETIQIPTSYYEIEEYIHGPNLQLTPNYTVFIIDGGIGSNRIKEIFDGTRLVTDRCFLISNTLESNDNNILYLPAKISEEITPLCYLPFFQMLAFMVTDELNLWKKHPLQELMEQKVISKSENYIKSPLKIDDPESK